MERLKAQHNHKLTQQASSKFSLPRSADMATRAHAEALGEIFDVLLVTALLPRDAPPADKPQQQESTNSSDNATGLALDDHSGIVEATQHHGINADSHISTESAASPAIQGADLLEVARAQSNMLQPALVAQSVTAVLRSLKQPLIDRTTFVAAVLRSMADGSLPPIGYLLTQSSTSRKPVAQQRLQQRSLSSEDRELLQQCRAKPVLAARATTERLVKGRYKLRLSGQQSVEESLLSCELDVYVHCD